MYLPEQAHDVAHVFGQGRLPAQGLGLDKRETFLDALSMRIAIVGTRGIPARYGGFETFAEELSTRLVARGHKVTVFGRTRRMFFEYPPPYRSVERVNSWTIFHKYLETPLAAFTAFLWLLFGPRVDVVLLCNAANSIFVPILALRGIPVLINVDGVERKRSKWGPVGRIWYRIGEICSLLFGTRVIADAYSIGDYYASEYGFGVTRIAYGAEEREPSSLSILSQLGIRPNEYLLYVSRLEPENNALGVIEAYNAANVGFPLVIVGDAPYADRYKARLRESAGDGVIFAGYQFGEAYQALRANCFLYIQATEVGGTHPALIEAMAYGNAIIANGVPEHYEVLGGAGLYYPYNDFDRLSELMRHLVERQELCAEYGSLAKLRAKERFDWERITDEYEALAITC